MTIPVDDTAPAYQERPMAEPENRAAPEWRQWVMDMLDDEQISHCGHLDEHVIVSGCTYCAELETHAAQHTWLAPRADCYHCDAWTDHRIRTDTALTQFPYSWYPQVYITFASRWHLDDDASVAWVVVGAEHQYGLHVDLAPASAPDIDRTRIAVHEFRDRAKPVAQ